MRRVLLWCGSRTGQMMIMSALVVAAAGGAAAFAARGGNSGVISACYSTQTGLMRFVGAGGRGGSARCARNERELSWNSQAAPSSDISVTLSATPNPTPMGAPIHVLIKAHNAGPNAAWVGLDNTIPGTGIAFQGGPYATRGTCSTLDATHTFTCQIGIMSPGQSVSIGVKTDGCDTAGQTLVDRVQIIGSSFDPRPQNNAARVRIPVFAGGGCG